MDSVRVGALRPVARAGIVASSLALIAMVLSPHPAFAATVIGSATGSVPCQAQFDVVQMTSAVSYAIPAGGGTITSWSTLADATNTGPVGLEVWRPTTTQFTYLLVGLSPLMTLTPSILNTFNLAAPIAVQAGDLLGMRIEGAAACGQQVPGTTYGYHLGATPAVGVVTQFGFSNSFQLDVEATLGTVTPPPPPPPGCDSSGNSNNDSSGNSNSDSQDKSKDQSTKKCKDDSTDKSKNDSTDKSKNDSTDHSNDTTTVTSTDGSTDSSAGGDRNRQ
jgi:hypothetical protein